MKSHGKQIAVVRVHKLLNILDVKIDDLTVESQTKLKTFDTLNACTTNTNYGTDTSEAKPEDGVRNETYTDYEGSEIGAEIRETIREFA